MVPVARFLAVLGLLNKNQMEYVEFSRDNDIGWANAVKRIPVSDASLDVVYSSHMVEHLDTHQVRLFLSEAKRVLRSGGTLRLVVPDVRFYVDRYIASGDADEFVRGTGLGRSLVPGLFMKILGLMVGDRGHKWMYDGPSLCRLLEREGFVRAVSLPAGATTLSDPGELNLSEREPESVFVEAIRP
jgi:predicted SAM-dependent methyltransferase